jgi:mannosyltransferase OCH1-like enzyme
MIAHVMIFLIIIFIFIFIFIKSKPQYEFFKNNKHLIPKIIHQTSYHEFDSLPISLKNNIEKIKKENPDYDYRYYNNDLCELYILNNYGKEMLDIYNKINPKYGPARSDIFRYLLIYNEGGVYIDLKSSFNNPLNKIIKKDDQYLISNWNHKPHENILKTNFG